MKEIFYVLLQQIVGRFCRLLGITVIAGGGSGIKQGQHLVMDDAKTPLCNLWLSLLQGSGIETDSFGDSTGTINGLFA